MLLEVADEAEQLAERLGARRDDGAGYEPRSHGDYLPRSPVVGDASPLAPRIDWDASPTTRSTASPGVEAHGTFGAPYEGPPGYVHGGMIALAFDEMLGIANIAAGNPGMTARLIVHYRKPTPLFHELQFRGAVSTGSRAAGSCRGPSSGTARRSPPRPRAVRAPPPRARGGDLRRQGRRSPERLTSPAANWRRCTWPQQVQGRKFGRWFKVDGARVPIPCVVNRCPGCDYIVPGAWTECRRCGAQLPFARHRRPRPRRSRCLRG